MKVVITQNVLGDIVRIGLYDNNGKWLKWVSKKELDKYVDLAEEVENKNV